MSEWVECRRNVSEYYLSSDNPFGDHWLHFPPRKDTVIKDQSLIAQAEAQEREALTRDGYDARDGVDIFRPFHDDEVKLLPQWLFECDKSAGLPYTPEPVRVYVMGAVTQFNRQQEFPTIAYVGSQPVPDEASFVFPIVFGIAPTLTNSIAGAVESGHELLGIVRNNEVEIWDPNGSRYGAMTTIAHVIASAMNKSIGDNADRFSVAPVEVYDDGIVGNHIHSYGVQRRFWRNGYCQSWVWLKAKDLAENGYPGKLEADVKMFIEDQGGIDEWASVHFAPINVYEANMITDDHENPPASTRQFKWFPAAFDAIARGAGRRFTTWCQAPGGPPQTIDSFVTASYAFGASIHVERRPVLKWARGDPFTLDDLLDVEKVRDMVEEAHDQDRVLSDTSVLQYLAYKKAPPESIRAIVAKKVDLRISRACVKAILNSQDNTDVDARVFALGRILTCSDRVGRVAGEAVDQALRECEDNGMSPAIKAVVACCAPYADRNDHAIYLIESAATRNAEDGKPPPESIDLLQLLRLHGSAVAFCDA